MASGPRGAHDSGVRKTVGVYETPRKPVLPRATLYAAVTAVAAAAGGLAWYFT